MNEIFVEDSPVKADLILVCGSGNQKILERRVDRASELSNADFAPTVLFSGGKGPPTEAEQMRLLALRHNVPNERIILEKTSGTTRGNAGHSRDVLIENGLLKDPMTVLLVTSPSHMFRALMVMEEQFPKTVEFICCPSEEECKLDTWFGDPNHEREVCRELRLIDKFVAKHGPRYPRRFVT